MLKRNFAELKNCTTNDDIPNIGILSKQNFFCVLSFTAFQTF